MTDATSSVRVAGDPMPAALAAYLAALDAGDVGAAVAAFAPDALHAAPRAGMIETGARALSEGHDGLRRDLAARGAGSPVHEVYLCAHDGRRALVEGVARSTATGEAEAGFAASITLAPDGRIARYLGFAGSPAPERTPHDDAPAGAGAGAAPTDMGVVLHDYFAALDRGDFFAAAGRFSDDVLYVHPPYRHTGIDSPDRVSFRGRAELLAAFTARGRRAFDHRITAAVQRGPHGLVEGVVEGLPGGGTGSFVSSLTLDRDGRIRRYVSYYCEPGVPDATTAGDLRAPSA